MTNCKHKFQPRYDYRTPDWVLAAIEGAARLGGGARATVSDELEKIYVCDVCVRCGKVVK